MSNNSSLMQSDDEGHTVLSVSHITCFPVYCATGEDYLRFEQCVRQRIGKAFLCP